MDANTVTAGKLPDEIGSLKEKISVEIGTRFLEHFSEQLYSSPQKAFEELISNGWDAGADWVDVRIPVDLSTSSATMCVLDNGSSMDLEGLKTLWHIAFSPKRSRPEQFGRRVVGKFGIGKLATYLLANKLTYICKAEDGIIRRVTMDYSAVEKTSDKTSDRLISEIDLDVFEVTQETVDQSLDNIEGGEEIKKLISEKLNTTLGNSGDEDADLELEEFRAPSSSLDRDRKQTWTLVVLSELKPAGRELKLGTLRRMLVSALPFGAEMSIQINGEKLISSKVNTPRLKTWVIGPELDFDSVELETSAADSSQSAEAEKITIKLHSSPYPHAEIPGIGRVTGTVYLFEDKISGGKSDERGASNGFHVNVLGRVVNQNDPSFGEQNLSHAAWARFRMAVRADDLNPFLTTNREQFLDKRELRIFRAFLRRAFNKARTFYDSDPQSAMPDGGDVLVQSLGVLSLNPLRTVVSDTLQSKAVVTGLFDETGIVNREEKRDSWRENTSDNIRNALGQIKYEKTGDESFAKFRISDNTIVVNKDHPFVAEHSRTKAEKELLRTIAMVNLLSDVYAVNIGIEPKMIEDLREYRDKLLRFKALQSRKSGTHIAKILLQTQHESENSQRLEKAVSEALQYLGFTVRDLAKSGEPEGIASAYPYPTYQDPTEANPKPPLFSFTFDAKSSKGETAKTGNLSLDGINEHRKRYAADYALVVAPGFSEGALITRCTEIGNITPIKASDLGRLLEYTVEYGAIPLPKLREMFGFRDPKLLTEWVDKLAETLSEGRKITIDVFIRALEALKGKVPDVLAASTVAYTCREELGVATVRDSDVINLVRGLQILVPDLIGITDDKIVVNASAERVAAAVAAQLEKLHSDQETSV
ncbi:ATP-binding protein [Phyllobacterium myrsinacearum]|uniref:ATP-binding protein n=1 Tax=Phyllobacterium myrsinacearum TaxID=28101 RepID=A0A2S9JIV5_9HYPH|nr:ATP-binding protein [Phyllobacterium myrsinacearum]PRD53030.1 ATP-binding protein [Phyllobacterium myrsinacearum]PWV94131.1 histidine kinase/DNA gyrase B/HSP90-like ATPase [Phyllobacterium myrsinacearum]RZV07430.1 histidine kinase/DNA gyrase B/HSP90-like ATPase [Phyllobacterium myrsinacearum]